MLKPAHGSFPSNPAPPLPITKDYEVDLQPSYMLARRWVIEAGQPVLELLILWCHCRDEKAAWENYDLLTTQVVTSLIHIESRKSPTAVLFDDDTGRISIRHFITKETDIPPEVLFEYQGTRRSSAENQFSSKPESFGYQSPVTWYLLVGSIVPLVKPLDVRKVDSSSYQALGACFNPYKAFLIGILFLMKLDQQTLLAEQHKPPPSVDHLEKRFHAGPSDRFGKDFVASGATEKSELLPSEQQSK
ncbi:hypothetical protein Tco_0778262 [Tanacetum coccineum]